MAAVSSQETVTFTGSSSENISHAKEFWKTFDANQDDIISTLHVTGINHRLPTAEPVDTSNTNSPSYFHQTTDKNADQKNHPGFIENLVQAQKRLENEEDEYVNRVLNRKREQQDRLGKQRQERLKKEAIRETLTVEEMFPYEEDDVDEEEATQAMNDIDDFDRMKKLEKEQEKEKKRP